MVVEGGFTYLRGSSASPGQEELRSLHGSALDTLHICYGCWLSALEGLLTVGVGVSLPLLAVLGTLFTPAGLSSLALM